MANDRIHTLTDAVRRGDRAALARVITAIENEPIGISGPTGDDQPGHAVLDALYNSVGSAMRIGMTGPPGAGKSTLTGALVAHRRAAGQRVAVLAVDPTSPFTGGSLLGDRVRMHQHTLDDGAYIRSMAARGAIGGLAPRALDVLDLLDAAGFDLVIAETVGVGQSEVEIAQGADTVVVVLHPESGDGIQGLKAGMIEIADVLVVNKADRPDAQRLANELETALSLSRAFTAAHAWDAEHGQRTGKRTISAADFNPKRPWVPPVLLCTARDDLGLDELWAAVERHRECLIARDELVIRRRRRIRHQLDLAVREAWMQRLHGDDTTNARFEAIVADLHEHRISPREAIAKALAAQGGS